MNVKDSSGTLPATPKRIALIGYPPDYFMGFAQTLERCGFEVYWVLAVRSHSRELTKRFDVPASRVLDTTDGFMPGARSVAACRQRLAAMESGDRPRIHDITLMDRILRRKSMDFALQYLDHLQTVLSRFMGEHAIEMVSTGRDTALQMLTMRVCGHFRIPVVVPTRARIPRDMYGFCPGHEFADLIRIRRANEEDRVWAREFLATFCETVERPALKKATRSFVDVVRLLPEHARVFALELKKSLWDAGNDFSRYTIPRLLLMYFMRRVNMLNYMSFPPYMAPGDVPFCLYALHTQPESSIDVAGSFFSDQIALITFIARALPVSHELYVKVHPTDIDGKTLAYYRRIATIPGVRLIDHGVDSRNLIRRASLIFSLTGTIIYEAALMAKPVVTFARLYFNTMPTVHYCNAPPRLPELVDTLLNAPPPDDFQERTLDFLANLHACMFHGEVNRMFGTKTLDLSPTDLEALQTAYLALYRLLVVERTPRLPAS